MIWAVVSTPLLELMREEGCQVYFKTAISGSEISFVGYALAIQMICTQHGIKGGKVEIGCDGLSALNNATNPDFTVTASTLHFDLLTAIRTIIRESPLLWVPCHIRGHQDDKEHAILDRWHY